MSDLKNKPVLVVGLGRRGAAACELLRQVGARVVVLDQADTPELRVTAAALAAQGVEAHLGADRPPGRDFALAVLSPAVRNDSPIAAELAARGIPVIGELELGYQQARCLTLAVAGTNGKATTGELIERMLTGNQRSAVLCGHGARPVCAVAAGSSALDYLILQVNAFQLENTATFRPAIAVLLNLAADHRDRYPRAEDYARVMARLFANQQTFDWAIVQSEALARLRSAGLPLPAKLITFSAQNRRADLYLDRGRIFSRLPDWTWPLLDLGRCRLGGAHNAENLMAALAVGHILRLPLDAMADLLATQPAGAHRCERVGEVGGVTYINDSKATNVDALQRALELAPGGAGEPNVWLIAGGVDKGLDFYEVGPLMSQRVKGAFLIGAAAEKLRAAWGLFTACNLRGSLLEAVDAAAAVAVPGDVILLSPACSSFDQFRNYQHRGDVFRQAVAERMAAAGRPDENGTARP